MAKDKATLGSFAQIVRSWEKKKKGLNPSSDINGEE